MPGHPSLKWDNSAHKGQSNKLASFDADGNPTYSDPGGGSGAVDSVNGQTGVVVLDATDVGADPTGTAAGALAAHVAAADPHPTYTTSAEATTIASSAVTTHTALGDPHTQYALESALGTASTLASDTDGTLAANSDARIPTQKAVKTYVDTKALLAANNLSDLPNTTTARTNLGLGDSATKNVGTTAGTVCAGNDARLTDSRTPTGAASGDLAGTYPSPTVTHARGLRDSGGTTWATGSMSEGQLLRLVGGLIVGSWVVLAINTTSSQPWDLPNATSTEIGVVQFSTGAIA